MRGASRPLCNARVGAELLHNSLLCDPLSAFFYSVPEMWFAADGKVIPAFPALSGF
jgi:hypothetical protein